MSENTDVILTTADGSFFRLEVPVRGILTRPSLVQASTRAYAKSKPGAMSVVVVAQNRSEFVVANDLTAAQAAALCQKLRPTLMPNCLLVGGLPENLVSVGKLSVVAIQQALASASQDSELEVLLNKKGDLLLRWCVPASPATNQVEPDSV